MVAFRCPSMTWVRVTFTSSLFYALLISIYWTLGHVHRYSFAFSRAIYKLSVDNAYPVRLPFSFGSLSFQTRIYIHVVKFQNSVEPDEAAHELTHLGQRCLNCQNNKVWTKQILNFVYVYFDVCLLRFT